MRIALPPLMLPVLISLALSSCAAIGIGGDKPDYIVFFTKKSAGLDPTAVQVIGRAAAEAKAHPAAPITILGYTDSLGSPQDDVVLSQRRAQHVADTLIAEGIAPARISQQGRGQTNEDPGVASRRVEIRIND